MSSERPELALDARMATDSGSAPSCMSGGGQMGALMRSFAWSETQLGPVASWPQSLRTAVSIMLESRFAMVVAWGPEFLLLYNDRYRPVLGATKHPAALGRPAREIFPEVWHFIGPLFDKTRAGEAVALDDVLIPLDRNGYLEDCWFTLSYSAIRDESGGVGGMLAVVAETTERVQGERRLVTLRELAALGEARSAEQACANADAALARNPIDLPFALLYLLDADGRGAGLAGATGLRRGSAGAPEWLPVDEERPALAWPLAEAARRRDLVVVDDVAIRFGPLAVGPYQQPTHTAVVVPLIRTGHERPYGFFVAGASPRRALDEQYRTFFELARDHIVAAIANALAYEEERRRAQALAELDRAKTAFFSNISHEFRTPLTLLLGPTEDALAHGDRLPDEELARWELVHRNALRLLRLVNALLDFARIEAGRVQASYEPTELAGLTTDLASQFRSAIERAGLDLVVDCPPVGEPVVVDRDMWEKIVLNLLSNALKFTFSGRIGVALARRADRVELSVADTGIGVAAADLPFLFERFHRVQGARARTHEGTGIGLALVQELVHLHGGEVRVESAVDRGTTFTVSLPLGTRRLPRERIATPRSLAPTAQRAAPFVAEALRWTTNAGTALAPVPVAPEPTSTVRILLADDNADMREYVARLLGERWTVEAAADGEAALAAALASPPDLVLADVMMPGIDGFALLRALRADERTRAVPVLFLSARAGEESRIEGLQAGADDYLIKPFSARELLARVATHLELSRLRVEGERARARLYALFMQAPVAVSLVAGPELVLEFVNPPFEELLGRSGVVGRPLQEAVPELDAGAPLVEMLRRAAATGEPVSADELCVRLDRRSDGRIGEVFFKLTAQPMLDEAGALAGIMTVAVDVTEAVRARRDIEATQLALAEENRINETLHRIGHALNADLDLERILQILTDEATALCRAAVGAFFYHVANEHGESYMLYALAGAPRSAFASFPMPRNTAVFGPTFTGESVVRSDDITADPRYGLSPPHFGMPEGHLPVRSYLAVPVASRGGEVLGGLFFGHPARAVFTEKDERLMVAVASQAATAIENARLYQQARRAEARTARLQAITAGLSHAVTATEAARTMLDAIAPLLGATAGSVLLVSADRAHLDVFVTIGDTSADPLAGRARVPIDSGSAAGEAARTGTLAWSGHDGAVPLSWEGQTIGVASFHCPGGRARAAAEVELLLAAGSQCALAIERSRLYDEARRSRAEAEAANRTKDDFLAILGHELRNPLAPIQTALQLMRLRGDDAFSHERTVIERQVSHVVRLVDDLLDVSRITLGKVELRREPVEVADVVARAIEMVSPLIEERRHTLEVAVPRSKHVVDADQVRLAQVVSNLLTNAAKYTEPGGRIVVAAERELDTIVLRVSDSGVGLPPEMQGRVFDLFVQERQSLARSQGGLGVGLTIVRSLVQLHGGSVEAHSAGRGRGSEFVVRLPASRAAAARTRGAPTGPLAIAGVQPEALRILVVDDNVDAADLLAESLRAMGHMAVVAYDGAQALRLARELVPQIALLDIGLPVIDGYELAERLLYQAPANKRPLLVAITGYGQETDRSRSRAAGFDEHLVKPIELDHLRALLQRLGKAAPRPPRDR